MVKVYMRDEYEAKDGRRFEYGGIDFYLVKSGSYWCIWEPIAKKFAVTWRKTRVQALTEFEEFMSVHIDKVREIIEREKSHT